MDFFSVLLRGGLLTWLPFREVGPVVLGDRYAQLPGAQAWAAFHFAIYLFGHLVSLLSLGQDKFYDLARRDALCRQADWALTRCGCCLGVAWREAAT